jgi:hypothetical protein
MMKKVKIKNILIYPTDNNIADLIIEALKYYKDIKLIVVANNKINHTSKFQKNYIIPSKFKNEKFLYLKKIILKENIKYCFPTDLDTKIELLEKKKQEFLNIEIISSPLRTLKILSNPKKKSQLLSYFKLNFNIKRRKCMFFTIFCISDRERGLLFCKGINNRYLKKKYLGKISILFKSIFYEYATLISQKIKFYGAWSFQVGKYKNDYWVVDISQSFKKSYKIFRFLGINFALLSIYEQIRDDFQILENRYSLKKIDRNKYRIKINYKQVYVDFDDTIIIKEKRNPQIIQYLYYCRKKSKKIILITKHQKNIYNTLERFKIALKLFNEIIHLKHNEEKSNYIKKKDSIFIDDSFHERKMVKERLKISTFDISMIGGLF